MKKLMKFGIVMVATAALVLTVFAQTNGGKQKDNWRGSGNQKYYAALAKLIKALDLSPEQIDVLKAEFKNFAITVKEVRESNLTKEEKLAKIKTMREEHRDRVMSFLTPEQQEKAKKILGWNMMQHYWKSIQARLKSAPPEVREQVKAIIKDALEQIKSVRSDTNLDEQTKKERISAIMKATKQQVNEVLRDYKGNRPKPGQDRQKPGPAQKERKK